MSLADTFAQVAADALVLDLSQLRATIRSTNVGNSVDTPAETVFTKDMTTQRPFRVTNTTTGRKVSCATYRKAQASVAAQIASDVEAQIVTITDTRTGEVTICRNNGLTIRYEAA